MSFGSLGEYLSPFEPSGLSLHSHCRKSSHGDLVK